MFVVDVVFKGVGVSGIIELFSASTSEGVDGGIVIDLELATASVVGVGFGVGVLAGAAVQSAAGDDRTCCCGG